MSEVVNISDLRRKIIKGYQTDGDLLDAVEESEQAIAEHQEALRPIQRRLERIERVQAMIQEGGVNRALVQQVIEETENPALLDEGGLTMESFTTVPSNVNRLSLEAITEQQKNIALGAAAAVGVGLVVKLIAIIWGFVRKLFSKQEQKPGEKAIDYTKQVALREEEAEKAILRLEKSNVIREQLKRFQDAFEDEANRNEADQNLHEAWNELLQQAFIKGSQMDAIQGIFNDMPNYSATAVECNATTRELIADLPEKGATPEGKAWFDSKVKDCYRKFAPQAIRKNLEKIKDVLDKAEGMRDHILPWNSETEEMVYNAIKTRKNIIFLNKIMEYGPFAKDSLLIKNKTFDEEAASHLDKLKEVAEKSTITKEVGASLKEYITYFGDNMKCYFAVLKLYMLIAGSYDRFMYLYNKQGGKYFTLLKAIAKAANKQINSFLNKDGTVNLDNLDEFAVNMEYKMGEGWTLTPAKGDD